MKKFFVGFLGTLLLASLIWFSGVTFYRMENTVSAEKVNLLNIEKVAEVGVKITAFNKEYFVDFEEIGKKASKFAFYDFFIPSEIKAFFSLASTSSDSVNSCLESIF